MALLAVLAAPKQVRVRLAEKLMRELDQGDFYCLVRKAAIRIPNQNLTSTLVTVPLCEALHYSTLSFFPFASPCRLWVLEPSLKLGSDMWRMMTMGKPAYDNKGNPEYVEGPDGTLVRNQICVWHLARIRN